jgi:flagellin
LLSRGRELSIQAANGTLSDDQRATLNEEIGSIKQEINRITEVTEFNGQKLIDGSLDPGSSNQVSVQAGIQNSASDRISLNEIENSDAAALGVDGVDISTQQGARDALDSFDSAISQVSANRASIGTLQNRLDSAASNLSVTRENIAAAKSAIGDLDYASEISDFQRNQILQQAGVQGLVQGLSSSSSSIGSLLNITG